ncbi:Gfo/Idh/MocA family protein [Paenibacillus koleovorans]|uniref:Gfo/Idh/MocA family protein n=1 Tax=Paenibacillus koleovorans TaxID=121608 RepID=UPI0013E3E49F|nr:Gfo/Idh/MocA family oxidoreductase [Paenibacillus koleovorans]
MTTAAQGNSAPRTHKTSTYRIGLLGIDTGHVVATAQLLMNPDDKYFVEGATVGCAFDDTDENFFNFHRVEVYRKTLTEEYGIPLAASAEELAEKSDAVFLSSIDARQRLRQFRAIAEAGKPVIVEKPFALSVRDAEAIFELADRYRTPVFCSSSLRYAETFNKALRKQKDGAILGIDCLGPLDLQPQLPGLFWYGVHLTELLFTALGAGCRTVWAVQGEGREHYVGHWEDGRIGTFHGDIRQTEHHKRYFAMLHREQGEKPELVDVRSAEKPDFACLLEQAIGMLRTGISPVSQKETLEIVRFMEAANRSRVSGLPEKL